MKMDVAVVGCGIVGSGVVHMLTENQKIISESAGVPVHLTHVVDVREVKLPSGVRFSTDIGDALSSDGVQIVVETIGGTSVAYEYTKRALTAGKHVVTSNKALVAEHGDELLKLAREHNVCYLFEASVGGGLPILRPIQACLSGNRITRVEGIINGSTNYLLSRMESARSTFPDALREAQKLGYVEGNPDADIEGWDARRKLLILAHTAFAAPLYGDELIPTQGVGRVTDKDIAVARALDMRIKLIARAGLKDGNWTGWVAPMLISKDHPFFKVDGVRNAICVHGDFVGDVLFEGQGAGSRPTASAVVSDILDIARHAPVRKRAELRAFTPSFAGEEGVETKWVSRIEGEVSGDIKERVIETVRGGELRILEGIPTLITRAMPRSQWNVSEKLLSALGIKTGIGLGMM